MEIQTLRNEYKSLKGSPPFTGWNVERLQLEIDKLKSSVIQDVEEIKRMEEAQKINAQKHQLVTEIAPVYLEGKIFAIINDKYVPWEEAEIVVLKNQKANIEAQIEQKTLILNSK